MNWINVGTPEYSFIDRKKVEKQYGAKYIGDFAIKTGRGPDAVWTESPVMVFYQPVITDPSHSHYLGIIPRRGSVMICDASSIANYPIDAVESGGEIIFSRYRWDSRQTQDGKANIDGGRDYTKTSGGGNWCTLAILEGVLQVIDEATADALRIQLKLSK